MLLKTFLKSLLIGAFLFIVMAVVTLPSPFLKKFINKESENPMPKTTPVNGT
jgi:hypothetical protein